MDPLLCVVLIKLLCFQGAVAETRQKLGLDVRHTITSRDYVAEMSRSDNITTPDWRRMAEACAGVLCVRYHKHCFTVDDKTICEYWFGRPGDDEARFVRVTAHSKNELAKAEDGIAVLSETRSRTPRVPLRLFALESEVPAPPPCPQSDLPCVP